MTVDIVLRHAFAGFALDVAFTAPMGVTALFGRSGSGKTTIVNAVAGLLRPQAGRVVVDGTPLVDTERGQWLPPHLRRVGYVFQEGRLFPHLSVRQNLLYGRWFAKAPKSPAELERIVDLLGLGTLLERRPSALSGGEKQRVAIGRALLSAPRLLLMDEPLASLDEVRKAEILPYLERIRDEADIPVVYVSHSVAEVVRLATTVVALHEGRVVRAGPAAGIMSDPDVAPSLGVREDGAFLRGHVLRHHADGLTEIAVSGGTLFLPRLPVGEGRQVRLRIEAQDILISRARPDGLSALNILPARVVALREGSGPGMLVQLSAGEDQLLARITRRAAEALALAPGVPCHAIAKAVSVAPGDSGISAQRLREEQAFP